MHWRRTAGIVSFIIVLQGSAFLVGGAHPIAEEAPPAVADPRDGTVYPILHVAGMTWFGRNLAFNAEGSSCPDRSRGDCQSLGRLYPWKVARSACPSRWHLATEDEWQKLESHLGMKPEELERERLRGEGLGELLKVGGATGLDIPFAGWRRPDGTYREGNGSDQAAAIWTATKHADVAAWHRDLSSKRTGIWRSPVNLDYSLSVRCVKD
jgi:uncharacterized protein (TIGR02145 family)